MTDAKQGETSKGWADLNTCGPVYLEPGQGTGASPEGRGPVGLRIRNRLRSKVHAVGQGRAWRVIFAPAESVAKLIFTGAEISPAHCFAPTC